MGVDYSHRVVVGVDISSKRKEVEREEKFLPYIEGHYGIEFDIVDDRESENFMYFGKVLARGDKYEGIPKTKIEIDKLDQLRKEVAQGYKELFNEECDESRVQLYACTIIW